MRKFICAHCGFDSLIHPGERCPGCGYFFSFLDRRPAWDEGALLAAGEEIPIRRLRCALGERDAQHARAFAQCTITNRGLRMLSGGDQAAERFIPYECIRSIERGAYMGMPARYFAYALEGETLALWFFADEGVAANQPDIDEQVMRMVSAMAQKKQAAETSAVCPAGS